MTTEDIFDRTARAHAVSRSLRRADDDRWLLARMADELVDRLGAVRRSFGSALLIGPGAPLLAKRLAPYRFDMVIASVVPIADGHARMIICEEDEIIRAGGPYDLIMACGGLDSVNDLPGALVQIRRALGADGLFLGTMMGAGSVTLLKSLCAAVSPGVARVHPQIDIRASGDLLARAGFTLPVADCETIAVRYSRFDRLIDDVRANALSNTLTSRYRMTQTDRISLQALFTQSDCREQFVVNYLTGWANPARS